MGRAGAPDPRGQGVSRWARCRCATQSRSQAAEADITERPRSAWTAKANKRVQFGYGLNYLIDIANAIIVNVEPTPARTYDEVELTKTMLDRTEQQLGLKPKRLAADTAYGTRLVLGLAGWPTGLHRTSRSAMPASATMAHYRAATFAGIGGAVFIPPDG